MKLSDVVAKLTFGKAREFFRGMKVLGGVAVAAFALAAPAAHAQAWGIGVQIGGPRYVVPGPAYGVYGPAYVEPRYGYAPGYWGERRAEQWRAEQWRERQFRERAEWERQRAFYGRGYGYRPY